MKRTRTLILTALFAALTAVGALIRIPTPTSSFTLQIFFTAMAGVLLGPKWGAASQAVYVLLGLVGLPVFISGGGPGALLQPTGGFLFGMIVMAWVVGRIVERRGSSFKSICLACAVGLLVLYAVGLPWMHGILTVYLERDWTLRQTVVSGMLVFLPWDLGKLVLAAALCTRIRPRISHLL